VNQLVVRGYLESWGHTVEVAENGREALDLLEEASFDLVLMDVQMPQMDGYEATKRIRQGEQTSGEHLPIVALTAAAMREDRARCLAAGMDAHLTKPIDPAVLERILTRYAPEPEPTPAPTPASESPANGPAVDVAGARAHIPGGEQGLRDLAGAMLEEYPKLRTCIREAYEQGDAEAVRLASHTLKGSASIFCASRVEALALRLEKLGQAGTLEDMPRALAQLDLELEQMHAALAELLQGTDV
jgi:two-component system sensor histidine kinase/response regulator